MTLVTRLFHGALAVAALLLLLGSALAGVWWIGLLGVALSGGWWGVQQREWEGETAVFCAYVAILVLAALLNVAAGWLLPAATAVLAAWDLGLFLLDLRVAGVENELLLAQTHLRALGQVIALALVLGSLVLLVQVSLDFWMAFALAVVAVVLFGRMMRRLAEG